jgi:Fe-S-cluster containining protein
MKIDFAFAQVARAVLDKPADMTEYATQRMKAACEVLSGMSLYACPPACNSCCHGTILMSYVEYVHLLHVLHGKLGAAGVEKLFARRLGVLEQEGKLLCPFVDDEKEAGHCTVYGDRPLICRVFGTSASPCGEDIAPPYFPEARFHDAYNLLHYTEDGSFVGLPLTETLVLYEATFDLWAIADSGHGAELLSLFAGCGSMRSVLYDLVEDRFFTMKKGGGRLYFSAAAGEDAEQIYDKRDDLR